MLFFVCSTSIKRMYEAKRLLMDKPFFFFFALLPTAYTSVTFTRNGVFFSLSSIHSRRMGCYYLTNCCSYLEYCDKHIPWLVERCTCPDAFYRVLFLFYRNLICNAYADCRKHKGWNRNANRNVTFYIKCNRGIHSNFDKSAHRFMNVITKTVI